MPSHRTDYFIVSQLVFAGIINLAKPHAVVINLISAGIAQAGSNQSGLLAYDLKFGYNVGASPQSQMWGQIVGSIFGAIISCAIYWLYSHRYSIPGPMFQVPSSYLVLSTARLLLGKGLPRGVAPFVVCTAVASAAATFVKIRFVARWWQPLIPSGVSFAIGECMSVA